MLLAAYESCWGSLKEVSQRGEAASAAAGTFTAKPVALLLPPLFFVQSRLFILLRLKSLILHPFFLDSLQVFIICESRSGLF